MTEHIFTGFGFGPIQGGLFVNEAFGSRNFSRIVIAEIDQPLVDAIYANNGTYFVNVAKKNGIEVVKVDNVEMLNPNIEKDHNELIEALSQSTEITTSLPSVNFFTMGENSVASLIAKGLKKNTADATVIYTGENNNHAAEILTDAIANEMGSNIGNNVQFLNTVIGKMSRVVTDPAEIAQMKLAAIAPGIKRKNRVDGSQAQCVECCCIIRLDEKRL